MALRDWLPWTQPVTLRNDLPASNVPGRGVSAEEIGTAGTENFGGYIRKEDYNPELDDWQKATALYDKMRRTDAQVRAMLQVIKLPLRGATWQCNPGSQDPVDKQIAEFCNGVLFDDESLEDSWDYVLRHILLQMDFGVSVLEKVWKVDNEGYYRYKRLAPRLPKTLREWHVNREGKLTHLVQYAPVPHGDMGRLSSGTSRYPRYGGTVSYQYLTIPANYIAVFTLEREGDNYEGMSLLRPVYRNWWFKDQAYHAMGVGIDRWGVGIPTVQLQEGNTLTNADKAALRDILQNIRANERAYMVLPEKTEFKLEPGSAQGTGTMGNFGISWIDHHDAQMARNVLASFLTMGRDTFGTKGFGSRLTDMFISSLNGLAGGISADLKKQVVRPLCDYNFDMSKRRYPDPVCLDLEQVDLEGLVQILSQLTGTLITPQDDDETLLRKMLGMPRLDPHRSRKKMAEQQNQQAQAGNASAAPNPADVMAQQMVAAATAPEANPQPKQEGS